MLTRCFLDDSCMACSTALSSSRPDELSDPCGRVWQDFVASTFVVPHFPGSDTVSDSRTWQHCFDTLIAVRGVVETPLPLIAVRDGVFS